MEHVRTKQRELYEVEVPGNNLTAIYRGHPRPYMYVHIDHLADSTFKLTVYCSQCLVRHAGHIIPDSLQERSKDNLAAIWVNYSGYLIAIMLDLNSTCQLLNNTVRTRGYTCTN